MLFGHELDFFPVISTHELDKKYVKNLSFTLRLIRHWKTITARAPTTAITQDYIVMWWLSMSAAFDFKVFYYPGLGNQFVIGRKPALGKILSGVYDTIQLSRLRKMDLVLAAASKDEIAGFSRKWSTRLRGMEIHQLPTAVDIDFFSPQEDLAGLKDNYQLKQGEIYLACVGRLAKVKGVDFLIDTLGAFNEHYGSASLLVVGDGEESASLRQYARDAGLADRVVFFGNVPPQKVRDLVNCADVCVIGSHFEGFSCAMVEQLACGKPLVSTSVSGADEIIEHGKNGFIVNDRDPEEFAKHIHKTLQLSGAETSSREIAVANYSERAVWKACITLLQRNGAEV
jgi:glycosyltransferase involved in cell wall biosynthesis